MCQVACGDCNGDGVVSVLDSLEAARHAVGVTILSGDDFRRCDVDSDWSVDILDALRISQEAAGLAPGLSCRPRSQWTQLMPPVAPSPRIFHNTAFDERLGMTFLFGGWDYFTVFRDTWTWNGTAWTELSLPVFPPSPTLSEMIYDRARGHIVLFTFVGGPCPRVGQTWIFDASGWYEVFPATTPPGRSSAAMAYDSNRQVAVLFGGDAPCGVRGDDTWEWDGTNWTQRFPMTVPPERRGHEMAYDEARGVVVMFGGDDFIATCSLDETWLWDGVDWARAFPATSPSPRCGHSMAYHAGEEVVVLFGGQGPGGGFGDSWVWNGFSWIEDSPVGTPVWRESHAMAYDSVRATIVMFGGNTGPIGVPGQETWEY
jgi:hypothetical protein